MQARTEERPKCMLPINGRPLLAYTIDALRQAGCTHVTVVTGHLASRIHAPGCTTVFNADYTANDILHSLMYARADLDDDVLVSYSDIFVEPWVHGRLVDTPGDIVLAVDRDCQGYYHDRISHPVEGAEKAFVAPLPEADMGSVRALGKKLKISDAGPYICGEFLGLWRMSAAGASAFRERFETLDRTLAPDAPFHEAARWRSAYVTDMFTDLLSADVDIRCLLVERGWAEFDVVEDYERLGEIIDTRRLTSLSSAP